MYTTKLPNHLTITVCTGILCADYNPCINLLYKINWTVAWPSLVKSHNQNPGLLVATGPGHFGYLSEPCIVSITASSAQLWDFYPRHAAPHTWIMHLYFCTENTIFFQIWNILNLKKNHIFSVKYKDGCKVWNLEGQCSKILNDTSNGRRLPVTHQQCQSSRVATILPHMRLFHDSLEKVS